MRDIFSQLFEAAKAEEKLIAIYRDTDEPSRFFSGYIQEYDETMVYLKSVDSEGNDDGYLYLKVEDVFQVEYNSRYLNRLQLLMLKQAALATPPCIAERQQGENYLNSLMKQAMADHLILRIASIYDYSLQGYVKDIDDQYLQVHVITDDGDDDGIAALRIEEIERVRIAGRDEIKAEIFYNNMSLF